MVTRRTPRSHCKRGHPLAGDNLDPRRLAKGSRTCLSCDRARGYVRRNPEFTGDLQVISDEFYDSIVNKPAEVAPSDIIDRVPEGVTIESDLPVISAEPASVHVIPFHRDSVQSVQVDGEPYVVFRPLVEAIGLDYPTQFTKLKKKSWATIGVLPSVGSNGSYRNMLAINLKTLTMWLATIDESRVNEDSRPLVIAYQDEVAEAIESYFTKGTATNPRVVESQPQDFSETISVSKQQLELLKMAEGLIDPDHLRAKANVVLARGLGEAPQLDPVSRPIYVHDFLKGLGLNGSEIKSEASNFGKKLKEAYVEEFGMEPQKYPQTLPNNQIRDVYAYTERDRPFMERVWAEKQEEKRKKEGRS